MENHIDCVNRRWGMIRKLWLYGSVPRGRACRVPRYIPLETPSCYLPLVVQHSCLTQGKNPRVCCENLPLLYVCNGCGSRAPLEANCFGKRFIRIREKFLKRIRVPQLGVLLWPRARASFMLAEVFKDGWFGMQTASSRLESKTSRSAEI